MNNLKDTIIGFGVVLVVGIIMMLVFDYIGAHPDKDGCIIGRDSPDCLEGGGAGSPIWNN